MASDQRPPEATAPPPAPEALPPLGPLQAAQPPPSRVNVWAILLGSLVDVAATYIGSGLILAFKPDTSIFAMLPFGLMMTVLGGYVAAAIAGRRSLAHGIGVGILSTIAALVLTRVGGGGSQVQLPAWYDPVGFGLTIPAAVLGAWLRRRFWGERVDRTMGPRGTYPSLAQAIWLLVVFVLVSFGLLIAAGIVVALAVGGRVAILGWAVPALLTGSAVSYGLVLIWAWRKTRAPAREVFPFKMVRAREFWPAVLTIAGFMILLLEAIDLTRSVLPPSPVPYNPLDIFGGLDRQFWAAAVYLVILGPVAEELLFRGVILRGFLSRYTVRRAVAASAVLFGAAHLVPFGVVTATILGVLFAWWRTKTGSLLLPMVGHSLHNALVVTTLRLPLLGGLRMAGPTPGEIIQPLWFTVAGVLLFAAGIFLFMRASRNRPSPAP